MTIWIVLGWILKTLVGFAWIVVTALDLLNLSGLMEKIGGALAKDADKKEGGCLLMLMALPFYLSQLIGPIVVSIAQYSMIILSAVAGIGSGWIALLAFFLLSMNLFLAYTNAKWFTNLPKKTRKIAIMGTALSVDVYALYVIVAIILLAFGIVI